MKMIDQIAQQPEKALWQQLSEENRVMLEVDGITDYMQPMLAHPDPSRHTVWFFAKRSNDMFGAIQQPMHARICLMNGHENVWADIHGDIVESEDADAMARHWSVETEAWFDEGRLDPDLMLLAFHPQEAEISVATDNPFTRGYEHMKALFGEQDHPDIGVRKRLDLA